MGAKIISGEFPVGETLPHETQLAELLGVSRTVVREAIKYLSGKGLVRVARRYGTRVRPFSEWSILDPDVIRWHSTNSPMATRIYVDASALRYIIEPEAAALAATGASADLSQRIMSAAENLYTIDGNYSSMLGADYTFHASILEASGNMMLSQFQGLILAILQFSYSTMDVTSPGEHPRAQDHIRVAEAITKKNSSEARRLMQEMMSKNVSIGNQLDIAAGALS